MKLAFEAGGGASTPSTRNGETALHGAVYRGGAIPVIQFLIDKGAALDVVNKKGWTPLTAADGVEYTPAVLKRYPEAAALLRRTMRERGMPVPDSTQPGGRGAAPGAAAGRAGRALDDVWDGVSTRRRRRSAVRTRTCRRAPSVMRRICSGARTHRRLSASRFSPASIGRPLTTYQTIRRTMPQEAPDSSACQPTRIVSYLFKTNGSPAGKAELPTDRAQAAGDPGDQ